MGKKYKIVSLGDRLAVDFYGAAVGDIVEIDDREKGSVWLIGSDVFKEPGWTGLGTYCVADNMADFMKHVKEVV